MYKCITHIIRYIGKYYLLQNIYKIYIYIGKHSSIGIGTNLHTITHYLYSNHMQSNTISVSVYIGKRNNKCSSNI